MYTRLLENTLYSYFFRGKIIILTGARQTGKTTLVEQLLENRKLESVTRKYNCDNVSDREMLSGRDFEFLDALIGNATVIFIDEGHKIQKVGETLKLLVDRYKTKKQIIVTGSSSINLLTNTEEPLTGRKLVFTLHPLSIEEIYHSTNSYLTMHKELEIRLVYGCYPEIVMQKDNDYKSRLLEELRSGYLYKDILEFQQIRNPEILNKLLKALALQLGSEVSYNKISNLLGIDKNTVERYVDLLEKNFIIFRLPPYTVNKRRELSKMRKIYFYDTGIRNAIINNFNFLENRNDTGSLWENYLIVERLKYREYHNLRANTYFWRTYDGVEVDLVEERNGKLYGYEFKWGSKEARPPAQWLDYENASWQLINKAKLKGFVY